MLLDRGEHVSGMISFKAAHFEEFVLLMTSIPFWQEITPTTNVERVSESIAIDLTINC